MAANNQHVRDLEMVRCMATYGPGPGTTPQQALDTIKLWAEKKLSKLADISEATGEYIA